MSLFHAAAARHPELARPPSWMPAKPLMKTMKSLASVLVPAHGFVGVAGLTASGSSSLRSQIWNFVKQLARGCAWAAAIAAGMLIYTTFTQKWKEKGFPTIPISALIAVDQATNARGIPMGPAGTGGATMYGGGRTVHSATGATTTTTTTRQTSLLDLDEYEG